MDPLHLFRAMVTAREIDRLEAELVRRGETYFHVSGAGHEASAALAGSLIADDWLNCHYRDKALMLARGMSPQEFFEADYCTDASHSRGRQMCAHMSNPAHGIMSIPGPVGNSGLHSVGVAAEIQHLATRPIAACMVGDGTTQQGEFLEACGEAVRDRLPVLFMIEDNEWAISTSTAGKTFYSVPDGAPAHLFGMPIHHVDGRDVVDAHADLAAIVAGMRLDRHPVVVVFHVERLDNHTNADDQRIYRSDRDIERGRSAGDPIERFEAHLVASGCPISALMQIRAEVAREVAAAEAAAAANFRVAPQPTDTAKRVLPAALTRATSERRGSPGGERLTMKDAIREVLYNHLSNDPRVSLYGQDIEDPKGDVFGVTRGLSTEFGSRVRNAPLSESTIVGTSVGRALAGGRPVAFLQFADFLPLAYNQIVNDLATMHWRSDGAWQAPTIVMAACGGYRPGLGPYHAQTYESVVAHCPGVDVMMPATAEDAAGMLNAAFRSERPTLFLYPKSCLNNPQNTTSTDVDQQFTPIGCARIVRSGRNITLVGWGNTVRVCQEVAETLETVGIEAEVIDLRSISPWDERTVLASAEKTARFVVVHEDNHTCGLGGEILATVAEQAKVPIAMRRVTRPDTFVPCNFTNQSQILPTFPRTLAAAAELLDLDLTWQAQEAPEEGVATIDAVGSGPADETVIVTAWHVKPGDFIQRGDVVAELEATKSVFDLQASVSGTLTEVLATEGETVPVGQPILKLAAETSARAPTPDANSHGTPILVPAQSAGLKVTRPDSRRRAYDVGLAGVKTVSGSRQVPNAELVGQEGLTDSQVEQRTGIVSRQWIQDGEDAVGMAVGACRGLLEAQQLSIDEIDLLICTTTTPASVTPSTACQVLTRLTGENQSMVQAYDINAACSGYLYALQAGYDYLQTRPEARVVVVTAEALSPLLNRSDQDTVFLFGDASSATLLVGEANMESALVKLSQPDLCAKGDPTHALCVPFAGDGFIEMNGRKVFAEAVRSMLSSLNRACQLQGLGVADLELIVPHQANDRISDAIARRVGIEVYSNIRDHGNTSSTSIPLCLEEVLPTLTTGARVGLCAFGGGFTFGATVLEVLKSARQQEPLAEPLRRAS